MIMALDEARRVLRFQLLKDVPQESKYQDLVLDLIDSLTEWDTQFRAHRLLHERNMTASYSANCNGDIKLSATLREYASEHRRDLAKLLGRLEPLDRAMMRLKLASDLHDLL